MSNTIREEIKRLQEKIQFLEWLTNEKKVEFQSPLMIMYSSVIVMMEALLYLTPTRKPTRE